MQLQSPSSRALSEALLTASKCITSKNSIAILDNVLLTRDQNGKFLFIASTSQAQLTIPAPLTLISGKFEKPIAIHAAGIISYLSTLPTCVVNLTFNDNNSLVIDYCIDAKDKTKTGKVSLTYIDGETFPIMSLGEENNTLRIKLPTDVFLNALSLAKDFSGNDEFHMVMCGMCIDVSKDLSECVFVATDGHSLVKKTLSNNPAKGGCDFFISGNPGTMIIHNSFFAPLSAFGSCKNVEIQYNGNLIHITSGDVKFLCKAIEGRYPNYNAVIPKDNSQYLCCDKKELMSVVKRVSLFGSNATNLIRVMKDGMFIEIMAEDLDFSTQAKDQVILLNSDCRDQFTIGLNSMRLLSALKAINADTVCLKVSSPDRACIVTADDPSPTTLALLMPMLLP